MNINNVFVMITMKNVPAYKLPMNYGHKKKRNTFVLSFGSN